MHRSNFKRDRGGGGIDLSPVPRVEQSVNTMTAPSRALNNVVSRAMLERMEDSMALIRDAIARMRDALVATTERLDSKTSDLAKRLDSRSAQIAERLDSRSNEVAGRLDERVSALLGRVDTKHDDLTKQIEGLRAGLASVGSALKQHVEAVSRQLEGSLNPRDDFDAIRKELAKLGDIIGTQKGHGEMLTRLAIKPGPKDNTGTLLEALGEVSDKLDTMAKAKPAKSSRTSKIDLAGLMEAIRAPKEVTRDRDGNISGWKIR